MSDKEDLLRAIGDKPDEDMPRLMYADWLDEFESSNDQSRATSEFIRVSCVMRGLVTKQQRCIWINAPNKVYCRKGRLEGMRDAKDKGVCPRCMGTGEVTVTRAPINMPTAAYTWLARNWFRLIPATVGLHVHDASFRVGSLDRKKVHVPEAIRLLPTDHPMKTLRWQRTGRVIRTAFGLMAKNGKKYTCSVNFHFYKGFLVLCEAWSEFALNTIMPVLRDEQPFVKRSDESDSPPLQEEDDWEV